MKGATAWRLALAGVAATTLLWTPLTPAASVFEFDVWMRAIDQDSVSVQKAIERGDVDTAKRNARQLEDLYERMERYFAADAQANDAVQVSREGKELAATIPASLDARQTDAAADAALRIARACNDCHDFYKPFNLK
jgi:hypothetical protein